MTNEYLLYLTASDGMEGLYTQDNVRVLYDFVWLVLEAIIN